MSTREDKRGSEGHTYGNIPHEKEATVVWADGKIREAASVTPTDIYLMRKRLQWYEHTGRQERQRVSHLRTYTS